jgi:hypothetical protein
MKPLIFTKLIPVCLNYYWKIWGLFYNLLLYYICYVLKINELDCPALRDHSIPIATFRNTLPNTL